MFAPRFDEIMTIRTYSDMRNTVFRLDYQLKFSLALRTIVIPHTVHILLCNLITTPLLY